MPSFDPNPLVSHDTEAAEAAYDKLDKDPAKPLLNRALSETLPARLDVQGDHVGGGAAERRHTGNTRSRPAGYQAPDTEHVDPQLARRRSARSSITLMEALTDVVQHRRSPSSASSARRRQDQGDGPAFGFEQTRPDRRPARRDDGMRVAASRTGDDQNPDGSTTGRAAQSCIGQNDVRMTPLQGALIAAAVANDGRADAPVPGRAAAGARTCTAALHRRAARAARSRSSPQVAGQLREMMVSVGRERHRPERPDRRRTRSAARPAPRETARDAPDHGWFIGFALARTASRSSAVCGVPGERRHRRQRRGGPDRRPGHAGGDRRTQGGKLMMIAPGVDARRPLPAGRAHRQRRHGRRLARHRRGARPDGRGEDPAARAAGRAGLRRAVPRRGPHHGHDQPPRRRRRLRLRQRPAASRTWSWSTSRATRSPARSAGSAGSPRPARWRWSRRPPTRCRPRTRRASCTATSSRATCWCARTARSC